MRYVLLSSVYISRNWGRKICLWLPWISSHHTTTPPTTGWCLAIYSLYNWGGSLRLGLALRKQLALTSDTWGRSLFLNGYICRVRRKIITAPSPHSVRKGSSEEWWYQVSERWNWDWKFISGAPGSFPPLALLLSLVWSLFKCKFSWEETFILNMVDGGKNFKCMRNENWPQERKGSAYFTPNLVPLNDYPRAFIRAQIQTWPQNWSKLTVDG